MGRNIFTIILLIVALIASNLITIQAYTVDSITKPSVPQFTVRTISNPYDVPPKSTTTTDQYTGKQTTTTQPGYHVENKSIEITIKNQPFTPYNLTTHTSYNHETGESYTYDRNCTVNFYYNIEVKGHYGNEWKTVGEQISYPDGPQSNAQLNSEYTTISVKAEDYPKDAVLDFRVQARIGYYLAYGRNVVIFGYDFYGQESDWSDIQTLTVANPQTPTNAPTPPVSPPEVTSIPTPITQASPTINPAAVPPNTQSDALLGFTWEQVVILAAVIVIVILSVALVLSRIKKP